MDAFLDTLVGWLWGPAMLVLVLGLGAYFTIRSGFWQFRYFGHAVGYVWGNLTNKRGEGAGILTSFEAFCVATSGAIGVGNIGGVASAIAIGGAGAVFWMWMTGLVGLMTKMVEVSLAVHYRQEYENGDTYGGPTYYLDKGWHGQLGLPFWKPMAIIFGVGILSSWVLTMQTFTVSESISTTFGISQVAAATGVGVLMYLVILGGISRIGRFSSYVVPFMALFYVVGGLYIIIVNIADLPMALGVIFSHAFQPMAAVGGFAGATFMMAIRMGVARGVYSNEAGWGSAPMAHATSKVDHPIKQGMWGIFEVFLDTIVVCSITALVIIMTGAYDTGLAGASLTLNAFEEGIGYWGVVLVTIGVVLFGFTTLTGWYAYYETILIHGFGRDSQFAKFMLGVLKYGYPIPGWGLVVYANAVGMPTGTVWLFADITVAIPVYVNLIALIPLCPKFFELLRHYNATVLGKEPVTDKIASTNIFWTAGQPFKSY
jgi:alanine or glycine:cation symporter, AGCS family